MDHDICVWKSIALTGTPNQIEWAAQIRIQVDAEFTRVRTALEKVAARQSAADQEKTQKIIAILEDKRTEVLMHPRAGYFIHSWQEPRDRVRLMILGDSRYLAIRAD